MTYNACTPSYSSMWDKLSQQLLSYSNTRQVCRWKSSIRVRIKHRFEYHIKLGWTYCKCQPIIGKTQGVHIPYANTPFNYTQSVTLNLWVYKILLKYNIYRALKSYSANLKIYKKNIYQVFNDPSGNRLIVQVR